MKHRIRLTARLSVMIGTLLLPVICLGQNITFHWCPCPAIDADGKQCSPAVIYEVYHQRNGTTPKLIDTVNDTTYVLEDAEIGVTHRIFVVGIDVHGRPGPASEWSMPVTLSGQTPASLPILRPNYPNPFNPETTIQYCMPDVSGGSARASLEIYSLQGRRVRMLRPETAPGWKSVIWDGTDDSGRQLPTGQYIVRFACAGEVMTTKMTMLK